MRITYTPDLPGEACHRGTWGGGFKFDHDYRAVGDFNRVALPYCLVLTCPNDPNWGTVQADISTIRGYFVRRIPTGTR